ncbi:MAG TPA: hypothetical protein VM285_04285 [Polyangia bacterium]|nr:hypothetical protein [Polyangia bacterium]
MRPAIPRALLWAAIPLVAILELALQWRIPGGDPAESDWRAAATAIAREKGPRDLVVIAPTWAVHGRVHLGGLIGPRDMGRFDTTRYGGLFEVSLRGARSAESAGLRAESERRFGALHLRRYRLPPPAEVLHDLIDGIDNCTLEGAKPRSARFLVDHSFGTRLAIPLPVSKRPVALSCPDIPAGSVLHGHAMIGRIDYRSHRLPSGSPVRLSFSFDGVAAGDLSVENLAPPVPFEIALPGRGAGVLRVEIAARDGFDRTLGFAADVRRGGR